MNKAWCLLVALWPLTATAQIQLVADSNTQAVFAGCTQTVQVVLRNPGDESTARDVGMRLFQLAAAGAVPIGDARPWKRINILPHQTALEDVTLALPEVRAATGFGIELVGIGRVRVTAWPHDLLQRFKTLAGDAPLGVFDPDGHLKPLLKQASVSIADFEIEPADSRLAIVWSNARNLLESVESHVKKGMSVVWIRSSAMPTSYAVRLGAGVVVVAPETTLRGLADSPLPQLTLIRDAELALQPDALRLPSDNQTE